MRTLRLSARQMAALPEYSFSYPTGVFLGKLWKASVDGQWIVRGYVTSENPGRCRIQSWQPKITEMDSAFVEACYESYQEEVKACYG